MAAKIIKIPNVAYTKESDMVPRAIGPSASATVNDFAIIRILL